MENQPMLSLYDYLGHAAGSDLGKKVAETAQEKNINYETKEVSNSRYTGKVMIYPKSFLDEYFGNNQLTINTNEDELPF